MARMGSTICGVRTSSCTCLEVLRTTVACMARGMSQASTSPAWGEGHTRSISSRASQRRVTRARSAARAVAARAARLVAHVGGHAVAGGHEAAVAEHVVLLGHAAGQQDAARHGAQRRLDDGPVELGREPLAVYGHAGVLQHVQRQR